MSQEKDEPQYKPTPRDLALEQMANASHERMMAELGETPAADAEPAAEAVAADAPTVEAEPLETETPAVEPRAEDQITKQMRKVKVDGQEMEVSEDDLVASYRQQETTRREMHRAQQARAEAERLLAEAQAKVPKEVPADRAAKVKEYHDALFTGDVETANRLFDEVMTTGRQESPPDVDAIVQRATPVLKQALKQELSNESALERFSTDFPDIIGDSNLTEVTKIRLQALMAEGKPYNEALFEAGNGTREWVKSMVPAVATEQPTTTRAEKLEKKAGIISFPTAHTKATSTAEPETTTADVIAEMRKRRGQG
jgi:hypothetical protein